jgi:hypothetical protein
MSAIKRVQESERRKSQSAMIDILIDDGLEVHGEYHFNRACTKIGMNDRREEFSKWRQANDVPAYATLAEWRNYATQFETEGDAADHDNTQ